MATSTPVISRFMSDLLNPGGHTTNGAFSQPTLEQVYPVLDNMSLLYYHTAIQFGADKVTVEGYRGGFEMFKTAFGRFGRPAPTEIGDKISTEQLPTSRRKIVLDRIPHTQGFVIHDTDMLVSQFEAVAAHAQQIGESFAQWWDEEIAKAIVLSSREDRGSFSTDEDQARQFHYGGNIHFDNSTRINDNTARVNASFGTGGGNAADAWISFIDNATVLMKSKDINIPTNRRRFLAIPVQDWDALRSHDRITVLASADRVAAAGDPESRTADFILSKMGLAPGAGSFGLFEERIFYKGVEILQSNNIPEEDFTSSEFRGGDYTKTAGMLWTPVSTSVLMPKVFSLEHKRDAEDQTDKTFAAAHMGSGSFRPIEAIEAVTP